MVFRNSKVLMQKASMFHSINPLPMQGVSSRYGLAVLHTAVNCEVNMLPGCTQYNLRLPLLEADQHGRMLPLEPFRTR